MGYCLVYGYEKPIAAFSNMLAEWTKPSSAYLCIFSPSHWSTSLASPQVCLFSQYRLSLDRLFIKQPTWLFLS